MNDPGLTVGSKVLVVDDKKENLDILTHILEGEGYEVSFAMEGEKAIQIASVYLPDLILLDVMMPGIDGFETCRRIKVLTDLRDIPIIFVTGKADVSDILRAFQVGAIDYVTKPIRHEELCARVKTHLQLRRLMIIRDELIAQMRQQNIRLEKMSVVNEEKLAQSEKMSHLGELIGELTHELSTPLGISTTALSTLSDNTQQISTDINSDKLSKSKLLKFLDVTAENYDIVLSNLNYAIQLINSFKKIVVGEFNQNTSKLELVNFLNDILHILRPKLRHLPHKIKVDCPNNISLNTQAGALSQVLINLINNALIHAFDDNTSGEITIGARAQADKLHLTVADNGNGIGDENLEHIFDKYFTSKADEGGSGLGLFIVKKIVAESLGGEISCQSSPEGTQFKVVIPLTLS
ncbi:hybrid sensor histidine kinase/response regulator [Thalassomonas viridans]|uniref:histidine kinase n=1 Tax=Thalassomonas viridans TaxID=137584 RepID=A0AAE9Z7X5_9GAMM|nr:hybrid sensor histidine kinase/response regulator [Thalassomonas viridans]WDE08410.1 hybrid sensor histidine kinase/response regulator [Thalassomonas viridans]